MKPPPCATRCRVGAKPSSRLCGEWPGAGPGAIRSRYWAADLYRPAEGEGEQRRRGPYASRACGDGRGAASDASCRPVGRWVLYNMGTLDGGHCPWLAGRRGADATRRCPADVRAWQTVSLPWGIRPALGTRGRSRVGARPSADPTYVCCAHVCFPCLDERGARDGASSSSVWERSLDKDPLAS